jgi:hypothetical protein
MMTPRDRAIRVVVLKARLIDPIAQALPQVVVHEPEHEQGRVNAVVFCFIGFGTKPARG